MYSKVFFGCGSLIGRRTISTTSVVRKGVFGDYLCTNCFHKRLINSNVRFKHGLHLLESSQPKSSHLYKLLGLAKPEKWKIGGAVLLLLVSSSVTMSVPYVIGRLIDVISRQDERLSHLSLLQLCAALGAFFVVGAAANCGRIYIMTSAGARITARLRNTVFSSIMRQEMAFFDATKTGALVSRLSADTSLVSHALTANVSDGLRSLVMAAVGVCMMCFISVELALVGVCIVPPVAAIAVVYGRYVKKITKAVQDELATANAVAEERMAGMRTVRCFNGETRERAAYASCVDNVLRLCYKEAAARAGFFSLNGLSGNAVVIAVLYCGSRLVQLNCVSVGDLSAFLLYAAYVGLAINGVSTFYSELQRAIGASERLWQLADRTPVLSVSADRPLHYPADHRLSGALQLSHVAFAYPSRPDDVVFSDLNLTVPAGCMLAVVGASGCGKSTLAWLLLRLYDPQCGSVLMDGVDVRRLEPSWLRDNIAIVSQEPTLFSCSIRDNIVYGLDDVRRASVSEQRLWQVATEANADSFIKSLSGGMDTVVGERGALLSGGQKQRIAIARAIIKDPRVLILDEATSALDSHSEHHVQTAVRRLTGSRTVLTIAHRLSTIRSADVVAVLCDGRVVEQGSYDQLINIEGGHFRRLVERQAFQS